MTRAQAIATGAGLASLVLFTALMVVIGVDYLTAGAMAPATALAIGAGVVAAAVPMLAALLCRKGIDNGRA